MAAVLAQLRTGERRPLVRYTAEDLEALEQEPIGELFRAPHFWIERSEGSLTQILRCSERKDS